MCHPIRHPAHIQSSMTLPTRPYAIFSTLQGTQNPDTKQTLQRAKNANAQAHPPPSGRNSCQLHLKHQQDNHNYQPHSDRLININYI
jgi:hypothetical protein